ncbi:hypothetical protein B0A48_18567 [Cryoendolithus antarcticus]|uniref:Uncharacterized protein n=1 Tax=Cryoendolithus antarcticus TaxID=1507870 RepID=A0A1V8S8M9_9PEZI|nr:hypothetical protein B0A48_18567 [Cryoendolithus antarcticus]
MANKRKRFQSHDGGEGESDATAVRTGRHPKPRTFTGITDSYERSLLTPFALHEAQSATDLTDLSFRTIQAGDRSEHPSSEVAEMEQFLRVTLSQTMIASEDAEDATADESGNSSHVGSSCGVSVADSSEGKASTEDVTANGIGNADQTGPSNPGTGEVESSEATLSSQMMRADDSPEHVITVEVVEEKGDLQGTGNNS